MELVTAIKSFNCAQKRGQEGDVLLVLKIGLEGKAPNGPVMAELQALEEEEYVKVTITRLTGTAKKRSQTELDL
jgi:hypothetical protein